MRGKFVPPPRSGQCPHFSPHVCCETPWRPHHDCPCNRQDAACLHAASVGRSIGDGLIFLGTTAGASKGRVSWACATVSTVPNASRCWAVTPTATTSPSFSPWSRRFRRSVASAADRPRNPDSYRPIAATATTSTAGRSTPQVSLPRSPAAASRMAAVWQDSPGC